MIDIAPQAAVLVESGGESMRQASEMRNETSLEGVAILETIRASGWHSVAQRTFARDGAAFGLRRMLKNGWTPDPHSARLAEDDPRRECGYLGETGRAWISLSYDFDRAVLVSEVHFAAGRANGTVDLIARQCALYAKRKIGANLAERSFGGYFVTRIRFEPDFYRAEGSANIDRHTSVADGS